MIHCLTILQAKTSTIRARGCGYLRTAHSRGVCESVRTRAGAAHILVAMRLRRPRFRNDIHGQRDHS
jgi:hypothetical protein